MIVAEFPVDEELRLLDLASYDIMDTIQEDEFDELVELAGQICNCPISLISLLDKDRQWFKAKKGLEENSTSRDVAFCAHAILQDNLMLVEDATKDKRFEANPLVTGDMNLRFYAGEPIVSPSGHKLGTICVIDHKPKVLSQTEKRALHILSNQVTRLLELRMKNKLIRKRAEDTIAIKSNAISRIIQLQEDYRKAIASDLHENLAQAIASSIFYVDIAKENSEKRSEFLQNAKEQLQGVIVSIREISYGLTPPSLNSILPEELIRDYVYQIAVTFPFDIQIKIGKNKTNGIAEHALVAIRIIEEWLKILAAKKTITLVELSVQPGKQMELKIEDDGPEINFEDLQKEIIDSLIYDRVQSLAGTIDFSVSPSGKNLLKVILRSSK